MTIIRTGLLGGAQWFTRAMHRRRCTTGVVWALVLVGALVLPAAASDPGRTAPATVTRVDASELQEEWWVPYTGGSETFAVSVGSAEEWVALSSVPWLTLSVNRTQGPGVVTATALPNDSGATRSGVLTLAGRTVGVTQVAVDECGGPVLCEGVPVEVDQDPDREQFFSIVVPAGTALLRIESEPGIGSPPLDEGCTYIGATRHNIVPRYWSCLVRQPVAGIHRVRVPISDRYQTTLTYWLREPDGEYSSSRPGVVEADEYGAEYWPYRLVGRQISGSVPSWMTLETVPDENGLSSLTVTVSRNQGTSPRLAVLTIDGIRRVVKQRGRREAVTVTPSVWRPAAAGESRRFAVSPARPAATGGVSASVGWLTLSNLPGTGSGALTITAAANDGPGPREGWVHVAGESIAVRQPARGQPVNVSAVVSGRTVTLRWRWPEIPGMVPTDWVIKGAYEGEYGSEQRRSAFVSGRTGSTEPSVTFTVPDTKEYYTSDNRLYLRVAAMVGSVEMLDSAPVEVVLRSQLYGGCDHPLCVSPTGPRNLLGHAVQDGVIVSWELPTDGTSVSGAVAWVESGPPQAEGDKPLYRRGPFDVAPGYIEARGLAPGTYTISVQNMNGWMRSLTEELVLTVPGGCPVPAMPEGLQAYAVGRLVTLRWDAPAGGAAPLRYIVTVGGAVSLSAPVMGREVVTPAPPGSYTIAVAAANACGTGERTSAVSLTVP